MVGAGTATLTVNTSSATAVGEYMLMVSASTHSQIKTTTINLVVQPFGHVSRTYASTDTPISIPDDDPTGITIYLDVEDDILVDRLSVSVDITHTYIGDLIVSVTSPAGTTVVLHEREGADQQDLHAIFDTTEFAEESTHGTWTLNVSDNAGLDTGSLDEWALIAAGVPGNESPVADFNYDADEEVFSFQNASTANDGAIVAWDWDFGDGTTSTEPNPTHAYTANGLFTVTLTVTDDAGASASVTRDVEVSVPQIDLRVNHIRYGRRHLSLLRWDGGCSPYLDIYRNGVHIDVVRNYRFHLDRFSSRDRSVTYRACEEQTDFCSNEVAVEFGVGASAAITRR